MLTIEILPNPNCEAVELRVFHDLEPPRPVTHVRLEPPGAGAPQWYAVTGWTLAGTPAPALARKVDDSGEGVVLLLSGGNAGLRLRPETSQTPWRLEDATQQGAPFLLIGDPQDVRFAPPPATSRTA